jgi:hypothetical protein
MMEDTLELDEDEELEEEADAEVDKVLFELTDGKLGLAGSASTELPVGPKRDLYWPAHSRDPGNQYRRGRDGADDGEISAGTQWHFERIILVLVDTIITSANFGKNRMKKPVQVFL